MFFINISRTAPSIFLKITVIKTHWWDLSIDTLILKIGAEIKKWPPILWKWYFQKSTRYIISGSYRKFYEDVIFSKKGYFFISAQILKFEGSTERSYQCGFITVIVHFIGFSYNLSNFRGVSVVSQARSMIFWNRL